MQSFKVLFIRAKEELPVLLPDNQIFAYCPKDGLLIFPFLPPVSFAKACIVKIEQSVMMAYAPRCRMPVLLVWASVLQNKPALAIMDKILCLHHINAVFIQKKQKKFPFPVKWHNIAAHFPMGHARILIFRCVKNIIIPVHLLYYLISPLLLLSALRSCYNSVKRLPYKILKRSHRFSVCSKHFHAGNIHNYV